MNLTYKKIYIKKLPFSNKEYSIMKKNFFTKVNEINKNKIISIDETASSNINAHVDI